MTLHSRLCWPFAPVEKHFGPGVLPERLRICSNGAVRVLLEGDWPKLVRQVGSLEEVITTTNNPGASLTQIGRYPYFRTCSCGRSDCGMNCGLIFDFSSWQQVWAARRQAEDGTWRTLTVANDSFDSHQVLLPFETSDEQFIELVSRFSLAKDSSQAVLPRWPANRSYAPAVTHLERCRQRKREFVEKSQSGSRAIHPKSMTEIWRNILAEQLQVSTVIATAPVIHSTLWQPVSLSEAPGILAVSSSSIFFRCQLEKVSELWAVPFSAGSNSLFTLEAYDRHDDLLFSLTVPPERKYLWNELLQWLPTV